MAKLTLSLLSIALVFLVACDQNEYLINSEHGPQIDEVIWFEDISSSSIEADSASYITFELGINELSDPTNDTIDLVTDKGFFQNGQQQMEATINANKKALVTLYSGIDEGPVIIQASINGIMIDTVMTFTKAFPEIIQMSPSLATTTDHFIKLDVDLMRNKGRVGRDIQLAIAYTPLDTTDVLLDVKPLVIVEDESDSIYIGNPLEIKGRYKIEVNLKDKNEVSTSSIVIFE